MESLLKNTQVLQVKNFEIRVVDIQDLINLKQKAGRGRDLNDILALRKIQELRNGK